jgi:uncharacterized protein (UPF0333 family)
MLVKLHIVNIWSKSGTSASNASAAIAAAAAAAAIFCETQNDNRCVRKLTTTINNDSHVNIPVGLNQ